MKILYHHRIRSKDGQYVHVEELLAALRGLGHEITIVGPAGIEQQSFGTESQAVAWLRRRLPQSLYELLEFAYSFVDFVRLCYAIVRHAPDVIYERYNLYLPSGIWASKLCRLPLFLEINAPLYEERTRYGGLALPRLARWTQRYAWRGATRCLPVTHALAGYVIDAGVHDSNIVVIPNGINNSMLAPARSRSEAKRVLPPGMRDMTILGFVGFVRAWHGLDTVVRLIAEAEFVEGRIGLLIVGDGPARPLLEQQARELDVSERVHFTGVVQRENIKNYLASFDIALQPNVVSYASPLKLFEYLAAGCAIVAPNAPNIREVLSDGEDALLFEPSNAESMRSAITRLVRDASLRGELGENARRTIRKGGYTWEGNAEKLTRLFESAARA